MSKYKNIKSGGYDSRKEQGFALQLELLRKCNDPKQRVIDVREQVKFELLPKQDGERAVHYIADFVVQYACGRTEVIDVKSAVTRKLPAYVLKRKMMKFFHGVTVWEV